MIRPGRAPDSVRPARLAGQGRRGLEEIAGLEADHVGETWEIDHVRPPGFRLFVLA